MKSNIEIAEEAMRMIDRVIKNELPNVSCPEKNQHAMWKRSEVKQIIVSKLHQPNMVSVGPSVMK
jgi:hypothetical protein